MATVYAPDIDKIVIMQSVLYFYTIPNITHDLCIQCILAIVCARAMEFFDCILSFGLNI